MILFTKRVGKLIHFFIYIYIFFFEYIYKKITNNKIMNYYEILNVDQKSTMKEIKKQYYKLSKIYHPDKCSSDHNKFLQISEAYNILSVPIKRS